MARLSITTAWNESADFLKHHFGALFTVAVALIALPNVAFQAFAPAPAAGQPPEPSLWLLVFPIVLVLGFIGSLTISTLALGREAVIGDAIRHSVRRVLPMLGASLILGLLLVVVIVPLVLALGIQPGDLLAPTPATAGKVLLLMVVILALALALGVRLLLLTPVAAAERAGPLAIITRSWALTRGHSWKLLGFLLLVAVTAIVLFLVVVTIVGLLVTLAAGRPEPGNLAGLLMLLVSGLLNAAFVVVTTTFVARIYLQLAGAPAEAAKGI